MVLRRQKLTQYLRMFCSVNVQSLESDEEVRSSMRCRAEFWNLFLTLNVLDRWVMQSQEDEEGSRSDFDESSRFDEGSQFEEGESGDVSAAVT